MTVFSDAIDDLFTDDDVAVDGTYTPTTGSPSSVRVILAKPEAIDPLFQTGAIVGDYTAEIRTSDLAAVTEGDSVTIGASTYLVDSAPRMDTDQLMWLIDLRESS